MGTCMQIYHSNSRNIANSEIVLGWEHSFPLKVRTLIVISFFGPLMNFTIQIHPWFRIGLMHRYVNTCACNLHIHL